MSIILGSTRTAREELKSAESLGETESEWRAKNENSYPFLIKYWFSVSDEQQEKRFQQRLERPTKRWKLSPMDLESRGRWDEFSKAKDDMFIATDKKKSPWYVVNADNKKAARLNCIHHLLSVIPYVDLTPPPPTLAPRRKTSRYKRTPIENQTFVPEVYG